MISLDRLGAADRAERTAALEHGAEWSSSGDAHIAAAIRMLAEHHAVQSVSEARAAEAIFSKQSDPDGQAAANMLLLRALVESGRIREVGEVREGLQSLEAQKCSRLSGIHAELVEAELLVRQRREPSAFAALAKMAGDLENRGMRGWALEGKLALARAKLERDASKAAPDELNAVREEAERSGALLIAHQAAAMSRRPLS